MKTLLRHTISLCILLSFISQSLNAQCIRYAKYPIGNARCTAYFPQQPDTVDQSAMDDGSMVYSTQTSCGSIQTGLVCVAFAKAKAYNVAELEDILKTYMNTVKEMGGIANASVGFGSGHRMESNSNALGIIDYCEDGQGNTWKMKGWIDERMAAVLYFVVAKGHENDREAGFTVQEMFLRKT